MKTKTLARKLSLSKETIAHLNHFEMEDVYGGGYPPLRSIIYEFSCDGTGCYTIPGGETC